MIVTVLGGTYYYVVTVDRKAVIDEHVNDINSQLLVSSSILSNAISEGESQTRFLKGTPPINGIVRATQNSGIDPYDQTPLKLWISRLQQIAVSYMENNKEILQIRYIGVANNGLEVVRVTRHFGNIQVESGTALQSKVEEPYFVETSKLQSGENYVSAINLNREYGKIVYPLLPTYRVSTPVYDSKGVLFGMLIVNYDGQQLLNQVRSKTASDILLYLVSHEGEFVLHPDENKQFAAQLGSEPVNNPFDLGQKNQQSEQGLNVTGQPEPLLFNNQRIWLSRPSEGRSIDVIAAVPSRAIDAIVFQHLLFSMSSLCLLVLILLSIVVFYQRQVSRYLRLNVTEAQFKAIVAGSQDAIVSVDSEIKVTSWNRAAQALLGSTLKETMGQPLFNFLELADTTEFNQLALKAIQESGMHKSIEVTVTDDSGEEVYLLVSLSPIVSDGNSKGLTLILRDISQEKRGAEEIRRLNASLETQVEERTADLEIARNQALQSSQLKSEFLANMSHEIRTPMNGIFGMLNLIKRGPLKEEQARYLAMAESSVESLSSLINDILDLSKVESGKLELEAVDFDLVDVMSSQISSLSLKAQQQGLEVLFDFAGVEQSGVVGDPHRFKQIITNLMGNAIKFTKRGEILITARSFRTTEDRVSLTFAISDTGVGIEQSKAAKLFEAFSQADSSTTRQFGGTGLGLSITRHLVEQMGGTISVESEPDQGATFTINMQLPVGSTEPILEKHKPLIEGKRVLVLAKNLNLRGSTRKLLRAWKANVDTTDDIDEVLNRVSQRNLDILIFDQEAFQIAQNERLMNVLWHPDVLAWLKIAVLAPQKPNFEELDLDGLASTAVIKLIKPISPVEYGRMLDRFYGTGLDADEQRIAEQELLEQSLDHELAKFTGTTLLIVDDVMINREVILGLLHGFPFKLLEAENGLKALEVLKAQNVDMILMDCQMPEMDGYMATSKIREGAAGTRNVRTTIVAMTAGAMAGDRDACVAAGMNDYITKPIVSLEFKQKLLHWLQSSRGYEEAMPSSRTPIMTLDDIDSAPDLNFAAAIARMGNNETIFKKMVDMYLEDTPSKLRSLSVALQNDQIETAQQLGHALKGTSATIGAEKMQHLCQQIEFAAEQNNMLIVREAVTRLNSVYPDVLRSLANQEIG